MGRQIAAAEEIDRMAEAAFEHGDESKRAKERRADVASALYRDRYLDRRVPPALAGLLADRRLAISLVTLGEAHYGMRKRKWAPERSDNDLWIAACASANGLPLVTLNRRHFEPLTIFGVVLL